MLAESDKRTEAIELHLKSHVDEILQSLCLGFVADEAAGSYSREKLDEIYRNSIYLLYRILFLFYAEARQLLPVGTTSYDTISLATIVKDARQRQRLGEQNSDRFALWKRLTRLCVVVDDGDESLGVRPYNGGLFSDTEKPYLRDHKIADEHLAPALYHLGYVEGKNVERPIDYRDLSVRQLGALYEGLLEYRLNIVDREPIVVRESNGKRNYVRQSAAGAIKKGEMILPVGQVYFADDKGERKSSGSYYTPEDVVQYIVSNTVTTKLVEKRIALEASIQDAQRERDVSATPDERTRLERYTDHRTLLMIEQEILGLKILDPAMGSGHFLVAASQAVTNFIVETLSSSDWPNDDIDSDPLLWKRRVVERCLYGVDLNPLAQELAKLALWISSASLGKPLTFLDHHLKVGNSLYGTPLKRLSTLPTTKNGKDDPLLRMILEATIGDILGDVADITGVDSDDIMVVKHKGDAFQAAEAKAARLRDIANVWLASLFAPVNEDNKPLTEKDYVRLRDDLQVNYAAESWEMRVANDQNLRQARQIAQRERFFHWELEFPDTLENGECRFDAVIANPPYVGTKANGVITALYETARCGDLYGWLFEKALRVIDKAGNLGTVVPLSMMFSQSFTPLRRLLLSANVDLRLASFDNIPDQIFNGGKVSDNTSKDNKQRTTIVLAHGSGKSSRILTTDLLRWSHHDRNVLFQNLRFSDTTNFCSVSSFPKLGSDQLATFWRQLSKSERTIAELCDEMYSESRRPDPGSIFLTMPRAAYNFISATPGPMARNKILSLSFKNSRDMKLAQVLLNSNVFYWYWRVFGDGFCLSVDMVGNFPVPSPTNNKYIELADQLDEIQETCSTYKVFRGERIPSYNFNRRMDVLLQIDEWIVKQVTPEIELALDIFAQCKSTSFLRALDLSTITSAEEAEIVE